MRFIYYFISILPLKFHYLVSSFCSKILIHFYRKKIVNDNLKKSFPLFSEKKINSIMKLFYENFCDVFLETIKGFYFRRKIKKKSYI